MVRPSFLAAALTVTGALAIVAPARAQYQPQMAPMPTPDADALAASMRRLAADPRDLDALITAGELSLKVGDASGAAALFKRAEQVDPMNGRVKSGMARILVTQERPGEALRYFDQAVGYGLDPRTFAGDRGLAYDLIGEGARAQRDYRLALKAGDNDEVRRRYALSLAISARQDAALAEIDTLLRRGDHGAWRARAFILAMTGDLAGATGIATRMMPPGMAQGLQPFFVRLPTLSATDKAFAVHFGEVRPTAQRVADARLIPALPVLGPDPDVRVQVAAAVPAAPPVRLSRSERRRRGTPLRVEVASAAPKIVVLPPAPGFGSVGNAPTDPVRVAAASPAPVRVAATSAAPVRVAAAVPAPVRTAPLRQTEGPTYGFARPVRAAPPPAPVQTAATPSASAVAVPPVVAQPRRAPEPVALASVDMRAADPRPGAQRPAPQIVTGGAGFGATAVPASTAPTVLIAVASPAVALPVAQPIVAVAQPVAAPATRSVAVPSATPTPIHANEDTILARIVAGLTIPGYELGVGAPPPPTAQAVASAAAPGAAVAPQPIVAQAAAATASSPPPSGGTEGAVRPPVVAATVSRRPAAPGPERAGTGQTEAIGPADPAWLRRRSRALARSDAADAPEPRTRAERRRADRALAAKSDTDAAEPVPTGRRDKSRTTLAAAERSERSDARGEARRGGDRRGSSARHEDSARTGKDAKARPGTSRGSEQARGEKDKTPKAESGRIWVQVAGGANEGDLPKAWSAVQSRTPALRGKQAYSTPLRATNRVVTGPFKTDAEARAFVNQLARQGVSAFPFTSDKGQKLTRLPPK